MDALLIIGIILLGPLIGSSIGVLKRPSERFMLNMLSFAAGVMLAVSFLQLIPNSIEISSAPLCILGIGIGCLVMFASDRLVPHIHPTLCSQEQGKKIERAASFLLVGIFLHNFPEGMAIGAGAISSIGVSLTIAIAIAVHDIPEAICTSAPYYYLTRKRLKSFLISISTIIPTVAGFLLTFYFLGSIPSGVVGVLVGAMAGLMIYISADELIPASCGSGGHSTIFSLVIGIIFVVLLGMV